MNGTGLRTGARAAKRCEAILVHASGASASGEQCLERATHEHEGNPVCWLHRRAVNNPHRSEPVRFVRQEAEILRALGAAP